LSSEVSRNVAVKRLDDFVRDNNLQPIIFVKLIAGGFEPAVLEGGWNTIKTFKPRIFLEVTRIWWAEHGYDVETVLNELKSIGYHFQIEHFNEMLPYIPEKYRDRSQFNILATPAPAGHLS
jgi:hypothetical protein